MLDVLLTYEFCPTCTVEQPVETPPSPDDHGADCAERACTVCGDARFVDPAQQVSAGTAARHAA